MHSKFPGQGFGAFWASGNLSALEQACLASIANRGYNLTLFSYEAIPNIPKGVRAEDASLIVPEANLKRVIYNGRPDLAHFSDLFRYEMIAQRDLVWVDTDILMLADPIALPHENILVREEQGGLNGAIIYFKSAALRSVVSASLESKLDRELTWGETGPKLVAKAARSSGLNPDTYGNEIFYPIEYYDIPKIFQPEYAEECASKCKNAVTLHLFNNILTQLGYWKDIAPPVGSFLHSELSRLDLIGYFRDTYPQKIMDRLVGNFRSRQNGDDLGVKTIIKQMVPSIRRTFRHYVKAQQ